jgi:small redox-active disulfide protein 2
VAKGIKILGPGCPKCRQLYGDTAKIVKELGTECRIEKVEDIQEIIAYGVMMTPALVVDGEVKAVGKVPPLDELRKILS